MAEILDAALSSRVPQVVAFATKNIGGAGKMACKFNEDQTRINRYSSRD